jgi:glutamate synthase (NADPH/NADH) large chain
MISPHLQSFPSTQGLYDPTHERDSCGVGFVVNLDGSPSHPVIERGIRVLQNLLHRGATGGDAHTGDGAGICLQIPDTFFRRVAPACGIRLPATGGYGVGMVFLPPAPVSRSACVAALEQAVQDQGLRFLGWRQVPTDASCLGEQARRDQPAVAQCFAAAPSDLPRPDFERKLTAARRLAETRMRLEGHPLYLPSFSSRTLVYKGLLMATQLPAFYPDLRENDLASALAVVHQRYSTNTFPSWTLAQPFRFIAHNGEINTLRGNLAKMAARESGLRSDRFGPDLAALLPVIEPGGSDSAALDNSVELLVHAGRDLPHAMMMLIPEAWGAKYPIGPDQKGFFEYHAGLMEPWDGPAAVVFTDGARVGALLDRNGLRPARYTITRDGFLAFASEAGVLEFDPDWVVEKGALRPGQMLLVDTASRRVLRDGEIKAAYSRRQPFRRWVAENKLTLHGFFDAVAPVAPDLEHLFERQARFGYTRETLRLILEPMAARGHEPVGSMGHDAPLAVFSEHPQLLFDYFKQLFAQVTNPPLDPIREELVMSLMTFIGNPANILTETPANSRLIKLRHPILSNEDLARLQTLPARDFGAYRLAAGFPAGGDGAALDAALDRLGREAEDACRRGLRLILLSDRDLPADAAPIPSLLAVAAVNRRLVRAGLRTGAGVIAESGDAREVMHLALLLGYGATAVNPWLAFESVAALALRGELGAGLDVVQAVENYIHALCHGLLKIMSKMGISTLRSYRGAQVFEAIGLGPDLIERFFPGTSSRVGGLSLDELAQEANRRHAAALNPRPGAPRLLPAGGRFRYRTDGERHLWTPLAIAKLQQAVRADDPEAYREYAALINDQADRLVTLRGALRFKPAAAVPLDEVEPASAIIRRFVTGAMSFGSISPEAHETLALAMNRLGAASNSGEGGEDPARYRPLPNGDNRCSAVKQVASGRFGVTAEYLVSARELQIKIAQGAKPGEGGQLPGHKVNADIARVRHSTPGVTLISPPPHHDIYSIEDIAQLIYDLKTVNPSARVSVKLVSESGVGTVAAGVAKAKADVVLISGGDGGTGASPLSSIQHAGAPWELGLAETQQTLTLNNLRHLVRLQADGQMKTGRDVVVAALLGAEEFGFATAPLVALGCVMMRQCHANTCPVGVATQDPELRRRFQGRPEHLIRFFTFVAEEVRGHLARLGFRKMDDAIGRCDLLEPNPEVRLPKAKTLDFARLLHQAEPVRPQPARSAAPASPRPVESTLDDEILPQLEPAFERREPVRLDLPIRNIHRAVGARISGELARRFGAAGLPADTITCVFRGAAGQSFGAFGMAGLTLILEGEANDYLGKSLSGARLVVKPRRESAFDPGRNVIAGNTLLYGATSGEVFLNGLAGERFAVRNSGARAVVEGVGDHGCEYMTGGRVVVLGPTGLNFAAGMSGGLAYVFDEARAFDSRCNLDMVDLESVVLPADIEELRGLIARHRDLTGSPKAARILENWADCLPYFVKVFPTEYRRVLGQMSREDEATEREEVVHG